MEILSSIFHTNSHITLGLPVDCSPAPARTSSKQPGRVSGFVMSVDCFLRSKETPKMEKNSGSSRGASGVVWLADCNGEVANHLIACHLSKEAFSKKAVILARAGLFDFPKRIYIECGYATGIVIC